MPAKRPTSPVAHTPFAVTVDVVMLTLREDALCVLAVRRNAGPFKGRLALPGGFVAPNLGLLDAARLKLEQKTGAAAKDVHLEQLGTYGAPKRDPRMRVVSVAYVALVPEPSVSTDQGATWVPVGDVSASAFAFDHSKIVTDGIERARAKLEYTNLAAFFCPAEFTLSELRNVYEIVWGERLDLANFRRKILGIEGLVGEVGRESQPGKGRPAKLYRTGPATSLHPPIRRNLAP